MPVGSVNGPYNFISFIHDMNSTWKSVAESRGISIDEITNTITIVDDILSWAQLVSTALHYMEGQILVCRSQNLSLSLKKNSVFPKKFECVGIDVSQDGNRPATSKHQLIQHRFRSH